MCDVDAWQDYQIRRKLRREAIDSVNLSMDGALDMLTPDACRLTPDVIAA
jgi:hypothetical protein